MAEKITLTGAAETLLGTLHARALDALSAHPVLDDHTAVEVAGKLEPGPGVRWFDVDQPHLIELRERVYDPRPGYWAIAASVTDASWLSGVPRDHPALVVAEGLTMYLPATEGPLLLRRLVGHLTRGEMAFDTYSRLGVRFSTLVPVISYTRAGRDSMGRPPSFTGDHSAVTAVFTRMLAFKLRP